MMKKYTLAALLMAAFLFTSVFAAEPDQKELGSKIKVAIFVQNRADSFLLKKLGTFNDLITSRLTQKGLTVIDKNDVLAKFRESRVAEPGLSNTIKMLTDIVKAIKTEAPVETISDGSALRISQMIGADYLLFVSIVSFGEEHKKFKGEGTIYGTNTEAADYILRLSIKVLDGSQGGSIFADIATVSERMAYLPSLEIQSSEIINKLLDAGSLKLADSISTKIGDIRKAEPQKLPPVNFTIKSNVDGATVELDGAAIGSTSGNFKASPGLHQIRISKERFATWEKTVNIYAGQALNVKLELSSEGLERAKEQKDIDSLLYRVTKDKKGDDK
ncbi:MAG: PEGA domain-containing protein [Candidatus Omnitrophica bacterium]|nr:PEGA domain-containing protein [Candidatus Omnitrophota bacterium]